jgi:hypothetical protein
MAEMNVLEAALDYLRRGWSVIPVLTDEKRPAIRWLEFQHRRPEEAELHRWFRRWPEANVGIVTGVVSGLVVLDIDQSHGGMESLAALVQAHGSLPMTLEAMTGGGGRHLYFTHPGGLVRNLVGLAPGIDRRGDGGYVVAPPSRHASGHRYSWAPGRSPSEVPPAPMPNWMRREATGADQPIGHPLEHWRRLVREGVVEGERNNTLASLCGHLLWHGIDPAVAMELLLCWNAVRCRPPLPEGEVLRTVESITRLHEQDG